MFQFTHPVRGATLVEVLTLSWSISFNSRTPCGVRQDNKYYYSITEVVSIHAPRAGCDSKLHEDPHALVHVSIHAPRAGCDISSRRSSQTSKRFQFTHPVRGATEDCRNPETLKKVSIHAPRAGCDPPRPQISTRPSGFNSRTPCGVRRPRGWFPHNTRCVSIHAPRAGCDSGCQFTEDATEWFQFTHPVRGATLDIAKKTLSESVSIHAPRAGCDTS